MSLELKIKTKHLAAEATIIRFEENKLRDRKQDRSPGSLWWKINTHRRHELREEQRAAFLARAYLNGARTARRMEPKRRPEKEYRFKHSIIPRAAKLINKYRKAGTVEVTADQLYAWSNLE